ncbi:AMP-binding protein [uncultured Gilvimarinus sp.]|uniref:AMP-binding protein n=1 Tax=uncultured Gilvimarinus sp. TaxID=1689143 RepID=UPI0030ECB6FB
MLFYLDDKPYDQAAIQQRWTILDGIAALKPCRRIAVCTQDTFEWLAIALYCRERGLSVAPIHPDTPHAVAFEKATAFGCDALIWQHAEQLQTLEPSTEPGGTLIQFSSGTTGAPKQIERRWADIDIEIEHYNQTIQLEPDVVPVVACSITHSYGFICGLLASMARGATPHIITGWNPKHLLRTLQQYSKPLLYSSPVFIKTLLMLWRDAQPLYGVMTSGAVMPEQDFAVLQKKARHIWQQYGCSEAGCVALAYQPDNAGVMGRALGHCQLVTSRNPVAPTEVIVRQNGRDIHTGDAGYLDSTDNPQLHFCGRIDDTIITAGFNVFPQEVEHALTMHPAIAEAVVFSMPDPLAGERVAAIYMAATALTDEQLRELYQQHLNSHQKPSWIQRVDKIPRLANGKISRRQLTQRFFNQAAQQPGTTNNEGAPA